jgi:hypothetical protein
MAFKPTLTVKDTGRKRVCSMYKCTDNKTVMVHRGRHSSFESLFFCKDCIRELAEGYIDVVGVKKAREVFAGVIKKLAEPVEAEKNVAEASATKKTADKVAKKTSGKGE